MDESKGDRVEPDGERLRDGRDEGHDGSVGQAATGVADWG